VGSGNPEVQAVGKKKSPAKPVALASNWLVCRGYTVDMRNSETSFVFGLDVQGNDGKEYFLRVKQLNDRTGLVQRAMRIMADRWPAFDWEFQADTDGNITDIR
jgi:hypothetical protein